DGVTAPAPADPAPPERVLGRLTRREDGHRAAVEGRPVPLTVRGVGHRLDAA
ncbi:MAG: hypothetical protein JWQ53_2370, partial [Klenkia sp.]|nr:hypothetical protein [Klenkia sp.]